MILFFYTNYVCLCSGNFFLFNLLDNLIRDIFNIHPIFKSSFDVILIWVTLILVALLQSLAIHQVTHILLPNQLLLILKVLNLMVNLRGPKIVRK